MTKSAFAITTTRTHGDINSICAVIANCLGLAREQLTAETALRDDLGVDSIDRLALAIELEERFDVVIHDDAFYGLRTIGDIVPCVNGDSATSRSDESVDLIDRVMRERSQQNKEDAIHVPNESY